jgi:hypothetical protein
MDSVEKARQVNLLSNVDADALLADACRLPSTNDPVDLVITEAARLVLERIRHRAANASPKMKLFFAKVAIQRKKMLDLELSRFEVEDRYRCTNIVDGSRCSNRLGARVWRPYSVRRRNGSAPICVSCGMRKASKSQTPEQRSAATRKGRAAMTTEHRYEIARKANAALTPEQRSAVARRRAAKLSPEQRSEIARKMKASQTPEQRSAIVSKGNATRHKRESERSQ